ncbi:MAG: RHS repeat-associated protein [Candidatus Azotimanducaceae bacterium]
MISYPHGGSSFTQGTFSIDPSSNRALGRSEPYGFGFQRPPPLITSFGYDANANRTSKTGDPGDFQFEYNERNRMVRFSEDNIQVASYEDNAFEQRVSKAVIGGDTFHFHDDKSGKLIAENLDDGTLIREYTYSGALLVTVVTVVTVDQASSNTVLNFVHTDHLGTPLMVTNEFQDIVWRARYSEHCFTTTQIELITMPIRYPGQYYDEEPGLHHNYHRDYDPDIGSYIQSDPIGLAGGYNTHTYAGNNQVVNIDPYGMKALYEVRALDIAVVGCVAVHARLVIELGNERNFTYASFNEDGKNIVRLIPVSDHGPSKLPTTDAMVIPPPAGISQADWDLLVLMSAGHTLSNPVKAYEAFPDPYQSGGNCLTTSRRIIEGAGGAIPKGFNPFGLKPDLRKRSGRRGSR